MLQEMVDAMDRVLEGQPRGQYVPMKVIYKEVAKRCPQCRGTAWETDILELTRALPYEQQLSRTCEDGTYEVSGVRWAAQAQDR